MRSNAHRRPADPALTFALAVALTPAISYPTIAAVGRGTGDLSAAAARIALVLVTAWVILYTLATVVTWLMRSARSSPPPPPSAVGHRPGRAASDQSHADAA
jgi:hypothetical protein